MKQEYQVLTQLLENEQTSQRKLSKQTGLSLGAVNILIKKMVHKGLVKVEKLNSRTMRYIITPKGMKEKTRLTYQFVRSSYRHILNINSAVAALLEEEAYSSTTQVILYGPADEVELILKNALRELNVNPDIKRPEEDNFKPDSNQLILTWRIDDQENLTGFSRVYNIMNLI